MKKMKLLIIMIFSFVSLSTADENKNIKIGTVEDFLKSGDERQQIEQITNTFLDIIAEDNMTKNIFNDFCSSEFLYEENKVETTNYHIISDFEIEKIIIFDDSAYVKIKLYRCAVVQLKEFKVTNDSVYIELSLKRENENSWKFASQINKQDFWFIKHEQIRYMSKIFNIFNPVSISPDQDYYIDILNRYSDISDYYHKKFLFSEKYLQRQDTRKLFLLLNEFYAHCGTFFPDHRWVQEYFDQQPWYIPITTEPTNFFTSNDLKNIDLIYKILKEKGGENVIESF